MKTLKPMAVALLCVAATTVVAQEPAWNASAIKACDRACLVGVLDGYLDALFKKDPRAAPPLSVDVRMTENTGRMEVGEGVLWRSKTEPTSFKITVADPVTGEVAFQGRLKVQGRDTLAAIRLKSIAAGSRRSNNCTLVVSHRRRSSCWPLRGCCSRRTSRRTNACRARSCSE